MPDIVSSEKRSEMMSRIGGKNTKPEVLVRKALHAAGYRFRLHRKDLPGTPDIVLPGRRLAIFVNGCFWHGHQDCRLAKVPSTRTEFWAEKLRRNRERDQQAIDELRAKNWRVLVVWECFVRTTAKENALDKELSDWISNNQPYGQMSAT